MRSFMSSIICVSLFLCVNILHAQSATSKDVVMVKRWSEKLFLISDAFWQDKKEQINAQLGEGGFERVKKYSDHRNMPSPFLLVNGNKKTTLKDLSERLSKLKNLHKAALISHIRSGVDYGNYVVLEVPYKGNEEWQPGVSWDTIYFLLPEKDVEIIH